MMMNIIQSPNNTTTMMMKRTKTSILPDPLSSQTNGSIEILGHYWPRVLHNQNLNSFVVGGTKRKTVIKKGTTIRRPRKEGDMMKKKILSLLQPSPLPSSAFAPLSPSSSSSSSSSVGCPSTPTNTTSTTSKVVIRPRSSSFNLVLDDQHRQRTFSPITGRPISPVCIKKKTICCSLLPEKSLREMIHQNRRLRRRSSTLKSYHQQQQHSRQQQE